jgi:hypothetical protein
VDEQPRRYRNMLALLWLPLALVILVPAVILLGLSYYVRAVVVVLGGLVRWLLGYRRPPPPAASVQPPHLIETVIAAKKLQR